MVIEIHQERDLEKLLERSHKGPVVVFKHSTQCSQSAAAYEEFQTFMAENPDTPCVTVLVIENRGLSDELEERFGIRHESPQAIVVSNGSPIWHASHGGVTARALKNAISKQGR